MNFDPRIQVRATFTTHGLVQVALLPYELKEPLKVGFALSRQWRRMPQDNHYAAVVRLQVVADTEVSAQRVVFAEAEMIQVSEVSGLDADELKDVLELRLVDNLLPYVRAQVAALLLHSGYHHLTLPPQLANPELRATEILMATLPLAQATVKVEETAS